MNDKQIEERCAKVLQDFDRRRFNYYENEAYDSKDDATFYGYVDQGEHWWDVIIGRDNDISFWFDHEPCEITPVHWKIIKRYGLKIPPRLGIA